LYTVLVGRPGLGKGSAINPIISILKEADLVNVLSDRMTIEYILERMAQGWQAIGRAGAPGQISVGVDHSTLIKSNELSVFISASQATLQILTDLWDTNEGAYLYGTRHKGEFKVDNPYVCLIGGSTQEWLVSSVPSNAVGGGFTRRVNFVVAHDREKPLPWPVVSNHAPIRDKLVQDLRQMSGLHGEIKFHANAVKSFENIYLSSNPSEFDDEATSSYKTSLWAQVCKVAMCLSAARSDDLTINFDDLKEAEKLVRIVASNVPKVFRAVGESELVVAGDKVLRFIENKGFASRSEILKAHWRDVTSDELDRVLATLKEGNIIYDYQQGRKTMYAAVEKLTKGGTP
jgi:hypothetical protein